MDYSWTNSSLWNPLISFGILAGFMLLSNLILHKISFFRRLLIPTAVLAGFIVLALRESGLVPIRVEFLEMVTYHTIALGFIAMGLRVPSKNDAEFRREMTGAKSGALIVGSYLIQGIVGLVITIGLSYTLMPDLFRAAGILLPMGYGQGPGQANNVGSPMSSSAFIGGQSFGLPIAAVGYLCAGVIGILYLNLLRKRNVLKVQNPAYLSRSVSIEPSRWRTRSRSPNRVDRFSMQPRWSSWCIWPPTSSSAGSPPCFPPRRLASPDTLNSSSGLNFIFGALLAMLTGICMRWLTRSG
jgi:ESS family glutamate:Na+ symporter